jgi:hypothetical protein
MPKIQKNYPRLDIKIGKSPSCGKVREHKKNGCFPASKGVRGRRPHGSTETKLYLKRLCFWALECVSRGPQGPKMYPK